MIVLVTGGSGNGKSALAESFAQKLGGKMIYIATMPIRNEDDLVKVERHHKLRAGKGFETVERQGRIQDIPSDADTIMLECLSTHTSNIMFSAPMKDGEYDYYRADACLQIIKDEIDYLTHHFKNVVFVSAESNAEGKQYDEITEEYKEALNAVNCYTASIADIFVESVIGIPNVIKGNLSMLEEVK